MTLAVIASMFISNVAASVLCFGLSGPILRTVQSGSPFAKALILGIAYAANIGGLTTSIASPQNVVTFDQLYESPINFFTLLLFSLPIAIVSLFASWFVLLLIYKMENKDIECLMLRDELKKTEKSKNGKLFVSLVALLTIILFCVSTLLTKQIGQMGCLAVIPMVFYFGSGVLGKDDFNSFMWNVAILAMGGSALGHCVEKCGLLNVVGEAMNQLIASWHPYWVLVAFTFITLIVTTFISHTVGALILVPVIKAIGTTLGDGKYANI